MKMLTSASLGAAILATVASALPSSFNAPTTDVLAAELLPRQTRECVNGPQSRNCWDGGRNINTNYYTDFPRTGRIREVRGYKKTTNIPLLKRKKQHDSQFLTFGCQLVLAESRELDFRC